jgi:hypothetical protein
MDRAKIIHDSLNVLLSDHIAEKPKDILRRIFEKEGLKYIAATALDTLENTYRYKNIYVGDVVVDKDSKQEVFVLSIFYTVDGYVNCAIQNCHNKNISVCSFDNLFKED